MIKEMEYKDENIRALERENVELKAQCNILSTQSQNLLAFKSCALQDVDELHITHTNLYEHIEQLLEFIPVFKNF